MGRDTLICPRCGRQLNGPAADGTEALCLHCAIPLVRPSAPGAPLFDLPPLHASRISAHDVSRVVVAILLLTVLVLGMLHFTSHRAAGREGRVAGQPAGLTRAEWYARLEQKALVSGAGDRTVAWVPRARFEQVMGRPARIENNEGRMLWVYVCTDGEITLSLDAGALSRRGQVVGDIAERDGPGAGPEPVQE